MEYMLVNFTVEIAVQLQVNVKVKVEVELNKYTYSHCDAGTRTCDQGTTDIPGVPPQHIPHISDPRFPFSYY